MTNDNNNTTTTASSTGEPDGEQLAARVTELEAEVEALTSADEVVADEQGRTWSLGALLDLGLSRREAMVALGAIGAGASFAGALRRAVDVAAANPDEKDVGTPSNPADAYLSNVYGPHGDIDFQDPVSVGQATIKELAACLELTTTQTISHGTETTVAFDNVSFEDTAIIDADPATGVLTLQADGSYVISAQFLWAADTGWSAGDIGNLVVKVGGANTLIDDQQKQSPHRERRIVAARMVSATANDTVKVTAYQNSGAGRDISGNGNKCFINVWRLRA